MKLTGLRILDLSLFLPGPHLTLMMADHGAEVIKLEPPGGEPVREVGVKQNGTSVWFRNTHRGKKSICINLKEEAGRQALLRIATTCDVVIEAFRPGVAQRLGIDYETMKADNPGLVYCSISAFGQDGPLRDRPAHDLAVEALSGLVACNVDSQGRPVNPHVPAADMAASLMALSGVLMALLRREQTGRGDFIDISMLDSLMAWTPNVTGPVFAENRPPHPPHERSFGGNAFYRTYKTRDGRYIALGGSEQKFVVNLLKSLGREDLAGLHALGPGPHQQPLVDFLNATFAEKTLSEWESFLADIDVCWAPVLDLREAFDQPQVQHRKMRWQDAEGNDHIGVPIRFAHETGQPSSNLPRLGQHNREVLLASGLPAETIDQLEKSGVLITDHY
ncbi:MAG: CoA transferase [Wenzhouxiangella sp.]|nr:MAG: CoA transferase [Wenzhouxiangella sp.]